MSTLGRPIEFTEVKKSDVCALLSVGYSFQQAAQFVGCSSRTIRRHAQRDELFRQKLRNAEARLRITALETIRKAAVTNWRAAAWLVKNGESLEAPPDDQATRSHEMLEDILEEEPAEHSQNGSPMPRQDGKLNGATIIPLSPLRATTNGQKD